MRQGRDLIGKPVVSYETGEKIDKIRDLIFDQDGNQLLGFLIDEAGWFSEARVLLMQDIQAIGRDAVIIQSKHAVIKAHQIQAVAKILARNNILKGTRILTTDGRDLGTMIDLYFDDHTGAVEGYEVSGGLFADVYSGRSFVPAPQTLKIGEDVAFVPSQTAELMEEQVGGIKAALQSASDQAQQTAQVAGEKLQEFGQMASEKAQETAQIASEKLQNAQRTATASVTNTIVDPEEQKAFVIGRVAQYSIDAPEGGYLVLQGQEVTPVIAHSAEYLGILDKLYRSTGGSLSDKLTERVGNTVASFSIEEALGRRVREPIRTAAGSIIAAPGQIVTEQLIERVKIYHQEQALLHAVGLSTGEAARDRASSRVTLTRDRLYSTTQNTGGQLQEGATNLWVQVKETANELQDRSTQVIEEKRIKGALGRPVTRVILDQIDNVILNVGELITHEAIATSRQAGVLDLLLNSVYTEKPQLSLAELRAPEPGRAAL
jgi:uncharacterized protein YrrD